MPRPLKSLALAVCLVLPLSLAACVGRRLPVASGSVSAPAVAPTAATPPARAPKPVPVAHPAPPAPVRRGDVFDARDLPLDQVLAEARRQGKPVALFFTATWCGWCHKLENGTLPDPSVRAELANWYVVRYDADQPVGRSLVGRFVTHGFPTVALLDSWGRSRGEASGYAEPARFVAKLQAGRR